jgi:hypothetical protein
MLEHDCEQLLARVRELEAGLSKARDVLLDSEWAVVPTGVPPDSLVCPSPGCGSFFKPGEKPSHYDHCTLWRTIEDLAALAGES